MIEKRMPVAYEGKPYPDGRIIHKGAIWMKDDRVPVEISGDLLHRVVGYASDLQRKNDVVTMLIGVDNSVNLHAAVADVYLQPIDIKTDVKNHDSNLIVAKGRLRAVYLSETGQVPLKGEVVESDEHAAWLEQAGDRRRDETPLTEERVREIVRDEIARNADAASDARKIAALNTSVRTRTADATTSEES